MKRISVMAALFCFCMLSQAEASPCMADECESSADKTACYEKKADWVVVGKVIDLLNKYEADVDLTTFKISVVRSEKGIELNKGETFPGHGFCYSRSPTNLGLYRFYGIGNPRIRDADLTKWKCSQNPDGSSSCAPPPIPTYIYFEAVH